MDVIAALMDGVMGLFQIEFTLMGFNLTLWQVFCFSIASSVVLYIIRGVLHGGR